MSPGFIVGAAGVIIGGDFKPTLYMGAVTRRYTSVRVLPFLFWHQGDRIVWRYGILDIVGRYSVPTRVIWRRKSFGISCITNRQTL